MSHRCHELEGHHDVCVVARDHEDIQVSVAQVHEGAAAQRAHRRLRARRFAFAVQDLRPEVVCHVTPAQYTSGLRDVLCHILMLMSKAEDAVHGLQDLLAAAVNIRNPWCAPSQLVNVSCQLHPATVEITCCITGAVLAKVLFLLHLALRLSATRRISHEHSLYIVPVPTLYEDVSP
jgi:hypothetical protein